MYFKVGVPGGYSSGGRQAARSSWMQFHALFALGWCEDHNASQPSPASLRNPAKRIGFDLVCEMAALELHRLRAANRRASQVAAAAKLGARVLPLEEGKPDDQNATEASELFWAALLPHPYVMTFECTIAAHSFHSNRTVQFH